jgi:hypothetical protein
MASKTASKKRGSSKRRSSRRQSLKKGGLYTWTGFVKKYMQDYDTSFGDAMHRAKGPWKAYKKEHGM